MSSRPSQKRTAASQNAEPSNNHKPKKTRILEPDEDPVYFEEQVEASLEKSTRRGKIRTEGYESDSTDDGEGVVTSRKKAGDEEDGTDDMFALSGNGEDSKEERGHKEKYIRLGDIEGQEFGDDKKDDSESEPEDEPEDEDDAERRKKAGMGFDLSSFHMRDEMEEGKFTEDGTYVRSVDPNAVHDKWMEGVSEKEIKIARRRKREAEKKQKERILAEEEELKESGGKGSMERNLLPFLKKGETVLEALQRLGSKSKKSQDNKR
jgi:CD2 antigen cytoplasmic tail-binding protein 2